MPRMNADFARREAVDRQKIADRVPALADARTCCYDPRSGDAPRSPGPGFGGSSNGRTADSDSACLGSNPSPPATAR